MELERRRREFQGIDRPSVTDEDNYHWDYENNEGNMVYFIRDNEPLWIKLRSGNAILINLGLMFFIFILEQFTGLNEEILIVVLYLLLPIFLFQMIFLSANYWIKSRARWHFNRQSLPLTPCFLFFVVSFSIFVFGRLGWSVLLIPIVIIFSLVLLQIMSFIYDIKFLEEKYHKK